MTQDAAYLSLELDGRAIGLLLHMVQDSYAHGHVKRTLLNRGDLVAGAPDLLKPTWASIVAA